MMLPLSESEQRVVGECLAAAARGPFFEDAEFETLFGVTREEMIVIAHGWPAVDLTSEAVQSSVHGALRNLVGYPNNSSASVWSSHISVDIDEVRRILRKLTSWP